MAAKKIIMANRNITVNEICEMLSKQAGLPVVPFLKGNALYVPGNKVYNVWIKAKNNKITITKRQKFNVITIIIGAVGAIIGYFLLGGLGAGILCVLGFWLGGVVTAAISGKGGEEWKALIGKNDFKIDDIAAVVTDRLQRLLDGSPLAPAVNQATIPVPASAPAPIQHTPVQAPVPMHTPTQPTQPTQAPAYSAATVQCTNGHFAGATFPINGKLLIGRDPNYSQVIFPLETEGISALHCEVSQTASSITLTDKGSTYGTFLSNGQKLNANESVVLKPGDGFYLANTRNAFRIT